MGSLNFSPKKSKFLGEVYVSSSFWYELRNLLITIDSLNMSPFPILLELRENYVRLGNLVNFFLFSFSV